MYTVGGKHNDDGIENAKDKMFNEQNNGSAGACFILYISLLSPAKQQQETIKFKICGEREHKTSTFSFFFLS